MHVHFYTRTSWHCLLSLPYAIEYNKVIVSLLFQDMWSNVAKEKNVQNLSMLFYIYFI